VQNLLFYQRSTKKITRFHPYLQKSYHVWRFLTFNLNNRCHGHNHGIVCSNDPILCKCVRLGMTNNVDEGSFSFYLHKKVIFYFQSATNRCFCEGATKIQFENWTKTIYKNSRPLRVENSPLGCTINHLYIFLIFRQLSTDLVGSELNLNYKCFIVSS
jgi:hypothetical protein